MACFGPSPFRLGRRVLERQCRVELRGVLDLLAVRPHHDTFFLDVNLLDEPGRNKQLPAKRHRDTWIDDQIAACTAFDRLNYPPDCAVTRADIEAAKIDSRQRLVAKIPDFCHPHRRPPFQKKDTLFRLPDHLRR